MGKYKDLDQERVYNSVIKIVNNSITPNYVIPYSVDKQSQSIGAGFFIDNQGHALTAAHVVENAIELWIKLPTFGQNNQWRSERDFINLLRGLIPPRPLLFFIGQR